MDSRPVVAGVKALDDLTRAAKPAEAATSALGKASTTAATGHTALAAAANKAASGGVAALTKQTGLARHEMINLSRQVQDVGVSLASGQSPLMVLVQQGAQIADIFGSSKTGTVGGAIKQAGAGILGFLGPVGLAAVGIGAVAAATIYAVSNVANLGKAFDDTARSAGTTLGYLHALEASAAGKGIETPVFLKAMEKFGASVYDAQRGMGGLAETFRANNTSASSSTTTSKKQRS